MAEADITGEHAPTKEIAHAAPLEADDLACTRAVRGRAAHPAQARPHSAR